MRSICCRFLCPLFVSGAPPPLLSFPTRRSSDLPPETASPNPIKNKNTYPILIPPTPVYQLYSHSMLVHKKHDSGLRSEEHTSELQSRGHLVCRLLLEKKQQQPTGTHDSIKPASQ